MKAFLFLFLMAVATAETVTSKIIEANNRFPPYLYKQIIKTESSNIILSPLSADTVLALLHCCCEGSTAQELAKALYLPNDKKQIQSEEKTFLRQLKNNTHFTFNIANTVFIQKDYKIKDTFLQVATDDFYAVSKNLDFSQSQEAANTINKWLENQTHNTIKNLIGPNNLTPDSRVVLVNALHFKGNWSLQFSLNNTRKESFYRTPNNAVKVDFMYHYEKNFNYYESRSLKAEFLELPFEGNEEFSMVIVLPESKTVLQDLEKRASEVFDTKLRLRSVYMNVALPKFKFKNRIDLQGALKYLGAGNIFTAGEADLSGISGQKMDLVVSNVIQNSFIDLNEGGVEAAAATFVGISANLIPPVNLNFNRPFIYHIKYKNSANSIPLVNLVFNRPFIYYIKYKNLIVFAGRVVDPNY